MRSSGATIIVATLLQKWRYLDDNIELLQYAGINIEKTEINGRASHEQRQVVLDLIERTQNGLREIEKFFLDYALKLISTIKNANGITLSDWYKTEYNKLETQYGENVKQ